MRSFVASSMRALATALPSGGVAVILQVIVFNSDECRWVRSCPFCPAIAILPSSASWNSRRASRICSSAEYFPASSRSNGKTCWPTARVHWAGRTSPAKKQASVEPSMRLQPWIRGLTWARRRGSARVEPSTLFGNGTRRLGGVVTSGRRCCSVPLLRAAPFPFWTRDWACASAVIEGVHPLLGVPRVAQAISRYGPHSSRQQFLTWGA